MIKQDVTIGAGKRQCLPELLDDPLASWMCRAVEMEKASSAMFDDKEAVECSKREWHRKEVEGGDCFAMVVQERQPALCFAVALSVGKVFEVSGRRPVRRSRSQVGATRRECGAPQRRFSAFMSRMRRRTSVSTFGRPNRRDFQRQNRRKPVRCQETTVSGLTRMRASAQPNTSGAVRSRRAGRDD